MDDDRIAGAAEDAVGDTKLQAEGKADKAVGTVRNAAGSAKDAARDFGDDVQGEIAPMRGGVDRPAVGTAAAFRCC